MDEVDKIIMHQLHQVDATIEPTDELSDFTRNRWCEQSPAVWRRFVQTCSFHALSPAERWPSASGGQLLGAGLQG